MSEKPNKSSADELLERARKLQEKADRVQDALEKEHPSKLGEAIHKNQRFKKTAATFRTIKKWLGPLGSLLAWFGRLILKWFRWAAFQRKDGEAVRDSKGQRIFSFKRFGITTLISLVILVVIHMTLSAAYYYGTAFEETVYVTGKQEIETGELYQFGGCTSLPCSTDSDNGKFYLIESSLYFPRMFYPEENVFANIPQQDAACRVEGYGIYFRRLRWLYKGFQLYQHVVNVSCRPYTEGEIQRAVDDGSIIPAT